MKFLAYFGVYLAALFAPLWFFALCALCYALLLPGYWLILVGVLIDAQFGIHSPGFPYLYTALTGAIVFASEFLKPHFSFYTDYTK